MSRIDDLIDRLAPAGVQYRELGEIGEFVRGNGLQKSDLTDEGTGAIHYGQVHTHYGAWATKTKSFVPPELAMKLRRAKTGDLVIATTSEDDSGVAKAVAWVGENEVAVSGDAYIFRHSIAPKYVAYFFQSAQFQNQKARHITGTKVRRISGESIAKIRIPVPPREVQDEIVVILDSFNDLAGSLEAELEARQIQYAHYRNLLMSFDSLAAERRPFGELATIVRGASPRPIQEFLTKAEDGVPWIKIGDVVEGRKYITETAQRVTPEGAKKSRHVKPGDFILSNSMSFGRPYISKIDGYIHDGWLAISDFDATFMPDFLYHLLSSAIVQAEFARRAGAGTVQNLNADIVKAVTLPVPTLSEQRRIVDVLDRFDALVNDPAVGLPGELKARRRQYEYYRDNRLFSFAEAAA